LAEILDWKQGTKEQKRRNANQPDDHMRAVFLSPFACTMRDIIMVMTIASERAWVIQYYEGSGHGKKEEHV